MCDFVIISGKASVNPYDLIPLVIKERGTPLVHEANFSKLNGFIHSSGFVIFSDEEQIIEKNSSFCFFN
jgi:hypothetical protein